MTLRSPGASNAATTDDSGPTEDAQLVREGERAAAAGLAWHSNPYLRKENMPAATGETLHEWSRKHDAWQRGFEGSAPQPSGGFAKEELPADMLVEMLERRIRSIPGVRLELQRNRWCILRVSAPQRCDRDADGRNWDVSSFECGTLDEWACRADFRSVVDELRDRYDLT